jgi:hypothetical protein
MKRRIRLLWLSLVLIAGTLPGCASCPESHSSLSAEPSLAKQQAEDAPSCGMLGFFEEVLYNSFKSMQDMGR